jgi:pSer/pThr/pTyr-binding forkhead associated (FHA) protein
LPEITQERGTISAFPCFVPDTERAVLEECGSKNGIFRGSERVTAPVELADGDTINLGSLLLTFHIRAPEQSTETQQR